MLEAQFIDEANIKNNQGNNTATSANNTINISQFAALNCSIAVWPTLWYILKMIQLRILNHNKGKLKHLSNLTFLYPYLQLPHSPLGDFISRILVSATCICLWNTDEKTLICTTIKQLLSPSGTSKNCTFLLKYRKILFTIGTLTYSAR